MDPGMLALLEENGLSELSAVFTGCTVRDLGSRERTPLLAHLKTLGVEKLTHRQKLAGALVKACKAIPATDAPEPTPAPPTPASPPAPAPPYTTLTTGRARNTRQAAITSRFNGGN